MDKANRSALLNDISESIERFVHQDDDRKLLHSILKHTTDLYWENEFLNESNTNLRLDIARLSVYEKIYEDSVNHKNRRIASTRDILENCRLGRTDDL